MKVYKIGNKVVNINITPRFGNNSQIFNYLISYAYGLYMPKGDSSYEKEQSSNYWLMAILWKATLEKALSKNHIPKEYKKIEKNSRVFRGKLKISQQIKNNLIDESRVYCRYRKLSMDTTINRTVRYLYKFLEKKGFKNLLVNIAEYDNRLHSFGVQSKEISITEIKNIRYSKLNKHYRQVMQLSTAIIANHLASSDTNADNNNSFAYFIDVAELWENYLLKVLQRKLPDYEVYSPNETGGEYLFENESRQIRPDIIIKKYGNIVAILDAKYKWYEEIGKTSAGYKSVSREDLYQMTTYLYHYGVCSDNIVGLFISPVEGKCADMLSLAKNPTHKIGVINLNINQWNDKKNDKSFLSEIEAEENKFICNIKEALVHKYRIRHV